MLGQKYKKVPSEQVLCVVAENLDDFNVAFPDLLKQVHEMRAEVRGYKAIKALASEVSLLRFEMDKFCPSLKDAAARCESAAESVLVMAAAGNDVISEINRELDTVRRSGSFLTRFRFLITGRI